MDEPSIITVQNVSSGREPTFVAHGPDGHRWLIARGSEEAALRDGTEYFLATRVLNSDGIWVLRGLE